MTRSSCSDGTLAKPRLLILERERRLTAVLSRFNRSPTQYVRATPTARAMSSTWSISYPGSSTYATNTARMRNDNFDRQHNNTNPVTQEPLKPSDLITLHYSRKPSGEIHDPISFKPFSEHSHMVAIATTGNVFLAESIKGGVDLVADVKFKK